MPHESILCGLTLRGCSSRLRPNPDAKVLPAARKDSTSLIEFTSSARSHIGP
jgi:hypothetical protein